MSMKRRQKLVADIDEASRMVGKLSVHPDIGGRSCLERIWYFTDCYGFIFTNFYNYRGVAMILCGTDFCN